MLHVLSALLTELQFQNSETKLRQPKNTKKQTKKTRNKREMIHCPCTPLVTVLHVILLLKYGRNENAAGEQ